VEHLAAVAPAEPTEPTVQAEHLAAVAQAEPTVPTVQAEPAVQVERVVQELYPAEQQIMLRDLLAQIHYQLV
jgi:hypothetical protein